MIFNDILERNNNHSDTLDFRRGRMGELGMVTFFVLGLKIPYVNIHIISHDKGRNFEPIFMKFT